MLCSGNWQPIRNKLFNSFDWVDKLLFGSLHTITVFNVLLNRPCGLIHNPLNYSLSDATYFVKPNQMHALFFHQISNIPYLLKKRISPQCVVCWSCLYIIRIRMSTSYQNTFIIFHFSLSLFFKFVLFYRLLLTEMTEQQCWLT